MRETEFEALLKRSSLHALLILTQRSLTRAGFGDVQILDRRQSKQKSRYGGHELLCELTMGLYPMRVVVKVTTDFVRLRNVDELAGTVRRRHADLGIIVSPKRATAKALQFSGEYRPMRLELLCGRTFAELLSTYHIGLRSRGEVDYAFFSSLENASDRLLDFLKQNHL